MHNPRVPVLFPCSCLFPSPHLPFPPHPLPAHPLPPLSGDERLGPQEAGLERYMGEEVPVQAAAPLTAPPPPAPPPLPLPPLLLSSTLSTRWLFSFLRVLWCRKAFDEGHCKFAIIWHQEEQLATGQPKFRASGVILSDTGQSESHFEW